MQDVDTTFSAVDGLSSVLSSSLQLKNSVLADVAQILTAQTVDGLPALAVLPPPEQLALGAATALLGVLYGLKVGTAS